MKKKTKNPYSTCTAILQNFTVTCHLYVEVRSNSKISPHPLRLYQNGMVKIIIPLNDLELVWMKRVLSDITQFSVFIIQIVWVPPLSTCLD